MSNKLCKLLNILLPIIQAGIGIFTSAELVALFSNPGRLGSLGTGFRSAGGSRHTRSGKGNGISLCRTDWNIDFK